MHHVFLCHSSEDHDIVWDIYDNLSKLGFRVWFDEVAMEPGDLLVDKIGNAIRSSINLAVILSVNSINSQWVKKEVSIAMVDSLAGAEVKVVPILLDDTKLPPFLSDINYVDWRNDDKKLLQFARLVKMLLSSSSKDGMLLRLVSTNAHVTATEQYNNRFGPSHVRTFSSETDQDTPRTYWLTPNDTKATISLKLPHAYPIRLLRMLNTQNQKAHDRAAYLASIEFSTGEGDKIKVWKGAVPSYPIWLDLWFDSVSADAAHVTIEEWGGHGGGLN